MKIRREWSLRLRLSLFFAALLFVVWSIAAVCSWRVSMEHIDTFFDTQQMLFAKRLAAARYVTATQHLPDTDDMLMVAGRGDEGEQEDDALAFAVFRPDGTLILSDGDKGKRFKFAQDANGFVNTRVKGDKWRIVWLTSLDRHVIVAVGQELEYRDDMAFEVIAGQMLPWLCLLPVLLIGLTWMLSRELAPLRSVAADLAQRDPDDATPIAVTVQSEVRPLILALNGLFARMGKMLRRERDFIANAAHELRTPLAGLSIQAQVACNARQPETREHALVQLRKGISRASRLVDQLLTLFKIESLHTPPGGGYTEDSRQCMQSWEELVYAALEEAKGRAEAKGLTVTLRNNTGPGFAIQGQRELLDVMLRNVVGNAVRYTPEGGAVEAVLEPSCLSIRNNCSDIAASDATRLGERFFRPAGQSESGSGLGLSIARRIAELHGLEFKISIESGWFNVSWGIHPGVLPIAERSLFPDKASALRKSFLAQYSPTRIGKPDPL